MTNNFEISSEIIEFYKNKSIFVTGATGFLGKALIEKLLRSCYHLDKIYILVRHKKGKTPTQRLDEIINCKVIFQIVNLIFMFFMFFIFF
jgi:fatty acyl-CoA reductase